jgi:isocitrate/isopropylmalate dehydrogenase
MTATNVIEEIKRLPRAEQSRVIQYAFELASERQLPGKKLSNSLNEWLFWTTQPKLKS